MTEARSGWDWMTLVRSRTVGGATRKAVMMFLAVASDEHGRSFWSVEKIAAMLEVNEKTVRRALDGVVSAGLITRDRRRRDDGTLSGYTYVLDGESIATQPPVKLSGGPPDSVSMPRSQPPDSVSNHRTLCPEPPDSVSATTGQIVRAEYPYTEQPENIQEIDAATPPAPQPHPEPLTLLAEDATPTKDQIATERFEEFFWPVYPRRHGRRANKRQALGLWLKLSIDDQRAAVRCARAYAAFCESTDTFAKDPDRWLRDRKWQEMGEPIRPAISPSVPDWVAALPNGGALQMSPDQVAEMRQQTIEQLAAYEAETAGGRHLRAVGP